MVIDDPPGPETVSAIPIEQVPEQFRPLLAAATDPGSLLNRAFALSVPDIDFNSPAAQAAEIPSSNGICTADGLARLYAGLIGEVDGVRILDAATTAAATAEQAAGTDQVLLVPTLVRSSGPGRVARLRRPGQRDRVRLRGQPHPAGHERHPRRHPRQRRPRLCCGLTWVAN
jgi:hypothetical protein